MDKRKTVEVLAKIEENITKVASIDNAHRKLRSLSEELYSLQEKIIKKETEIQKTIRFIDIIKRLKKREYDNDSIELLSKDNRILDISVSGQTIAILTDYLYYNDSRTNRRHLLGKFLIESCFASYRATKAYNLTMTVVGSMSHPQNGPHIMSDNHCCLGNAENMFKECVVSQDALGLIVVIMAFIESVNTDDTSGSGVENWPFVTPQGLMAIDPNKIFKPDISPHVIQKFVNLGIDKNLINANFNSEDQFIKFVNSIHGFKKQK